MSGDLVLVGAPVDGDGGVPRAGAAYLFRITTGELVRAFRKPAAAEGDFFGGAVAMVAGNVVVGRRSTTRSRWTPGRCTSSAEG